MTEPGRAAPLLRAYRWWLLLWLPLALWFVRPLWVAPILPVEELPSYLAQITAYHYATSELWRVGRAVTPSLAPLPEVGYLYAVHLLSYVTGSVTRANLLYLSVYVALAPLAGLALARTAGRSPWLSFLLLPLAVSGPFQKGLFPFCVATMAMLPACALLYRLLDKPSRRRALLLAAAACGLYLLDLIPWLGFCAYVLVLVALELATPPFALGFSRRAVAAGLAVSALLPSWLLCGAGFSSARARGLFAVRAASSGFETLPLASQAAALLDLWVSRSVDEWVELALGLVLLVLIASDEGKSAETAPHRLRLPLAVMLFLSLAMLLPSQLALPLAGPWVKLRFLVLAMACAVFLPRGPVRGARAWLLAAGLAAMTILPFSMSRAYREFSARVRPLVVVLSAVPMGANTLYIHTPGQSFTDAQAGRWLQPWRNLVHFPMLFRGGYDPYLRSDALIIRRSAGLRAPPLDEPGETPRPVEFSRLPLSLLHGWDYLVVRDDNLAAVPGGGITLVLERGRFSLFRNALKRTGEQDEPLEP